MLIVQKFGGSSLADIERLRRSARICLAAARREHSIVAVVSAMGDATDELIEYAHKISPSPDPRELDALMTTGEQQSAALMAIMLESLGAPAHSLTGWQAGILTDLHHGGSDIRFIAPERIREILSRGQIAVVTGFQGFCINGDITTLGRGGSDTSAVAIAAALDADRCEIYTDVDGIYTADPRIIRGAKKLDSIDFRDMLALASAGSQVLHPRSVELAMINRVPIYLLSSFEEGSGSTVRFLPDTARAPLVGVTGDWAQGTVTIVGKGADASVLSEAALLLSPHGVGVNGGTIGQGLVSLDVGTDKLTDAMQLIHDELLRP